MLLWFSQYISPSYQAPELLLGSTELSTAADIFSAGCIFGEMLILKPLFEADELASIFKYNDNYNYTFLCLFF